MAYGVALGLGLVVYYARPVLLTIPVYAGFAAKLVEIQADYSGLTIWPWETCWWWLLAGGALGTAAACLLPVGLGAPGRWLAARGAAGPGPGVGHGPAGCHPIFGHLSLAVGLTEAGSSR